MLAQAPTLNQAQIVVSDSGRPAANNLTVSDRIIIKSDCALWGLVATAYRELFASRKSGMSGPRNSPPGFVLIEEGNLDMPLRVVEPTGEFFSGPRGKLLVIKKPR
jgi:hypothetical protein